jgi:nicotinamidase-related amidase/glutathione S-transferase
MFSRFHSSEPTINMTTALLLIDLQNDFLAADGAMSRNNYLGQNPQLSSNISAAISHARVQNWPVIWIRSEYPQEKLPPSRPNRPLGLRYKGVPMNDDFHASSHSGKSIFCVPGSYGSELYPEFEKLRHEGDAVISKQYYSAFTNTGLAEHLRDKGITTVALAGVTASNCVRATAVDAFLNEFEVYAIPQCIGATSPELHGTAMREIAAYYAQVESDLKKIPGANTKFIQENKDERVLYFVNGSIPSWRVMMMLSELGLEYTPKRLKVMSKPRETRSAAFSRLNPRCKTPTLIDGCATVIESMAILQYLEQKYGHGGKEDDWTTTLIRFHESENPRNVFEDIELCFEDNLTSEQQERVVGAVDNTMAEMAHWESYLQENAYVAGDKFSIADVAFYPCIAYLEHRGWDFDGFPALKRYTDEVGQRKSAIVACPNGWHRKGGMDLWKRALKWKEV